MSIKNANVLEQTVNILEEMSNESQFISYDFLKKFLGIRKDEFMSAYTSLPGCITYLSGNGTKSKLLNIKTVCAFIHDLIDNEENEELSVDTDYSTSDAMTDELVQKFGDPQTVYTLLHKTLGDLNDSSGPINYKQYFPVFSFNLKNTPVQTKPTYKLMERVLSECGLFVRISPTKFKYSSTLPLSELVEG